MGLPRSSREASSGLRGARAHVGQLDARASTQNTDRERGKATGLSLVFVDCSEKSDLVGARTLNLIPDVLQLGRNVPHRSVGEANLSLLALDGSLDVALHRHSLVGASLSCAES